MNGTPERWREIVTQATIGTSRDASLTEEQLLNSAALESTATRAGFLGLADGPAAVSEAPGEAAPVVVNGAGHLIRCLELGEDLVAEWLEHAAKVGVLAPPAALPALLQQGVRSPRLRSLLPSIIGARGRWLAALNHAWSYVGASDEPEDLEELWLIGDPPQRLRALTLLRKRDPQRTLDLLAASIGEEPAATRLSMLMALQESLRPEDEPFLLSRLEDRSQQVREAAVRLLALIPGSTIAVEAQTLATSLVETRRTLLGTKLEVTLLSDPEASKTRLSEILGQKLPQLGPRESLLARLIGVVPPQAWSDRLRLAAPGLLNLTRKHENGLALRIGWAMGTALFKDPVWAEALLERALDGETEFGDVENYAAILNPARLDEVLRNQPSAIRGPAYHRALGTLTQWSPELSRRELGTLEERLTNVASSAYGQEGAWTAMRLSLDVTSQALGMIKPENESRIGIWREILPLRREMRQTILEAK